MRISDWSSDVCSSDLQDGATIFYGPSVIYLSKKFHAPTLDCTSFGPAAKNADVQRNFDRIEKALKPALSNLGGHIIRSSGAEGFYEKLHILVPFAFAMSESSTAYRSEEQTSELQSLMRISYAVFYLKKNNHMNRNLQTN